MAPLVRYNHIKSFGDLKNKFPGDVAKKAAAAADDDDDVDLFVSDDEEVCYLFMTWQSQLGLCR